MDYDNLDEETIAKRKKDQIEYRTKKHFSTMFTLLSSLFEVVETVLIIFVLFFGAALVMFKLLGITSETGGNFFAVLIIVIFFVGMVLGFIIYKKVVRWAIKKFGLKEKLLDDILTHYFKEEEIEKL